MIRLRNFVILAVILSASVLASGCDGGPKTEVRVEPADDTDDSPESRSGVSSKTDKAGGSEQAEATSQVYDSLAADTAYIEPDTVSSALDHGVAETDEEFSGFSASDSLELPDYTDYEDYSDEFLTEESEIAVNRLLSSEVVRVINPDLRDSYDSLLVVIEERLTIRPDPTADKVVLEKWKSPVNYKGYKFNMRKLMLFGVDIHYPVKVYHYMGQYYFSSGGELYELEVFPDFSHFRAASDSALSRYLLNFEN